MSMSRRLSYANVVATLALVFAITGGAIAAQHYLITSTKQISPKVVKKLRGHRGRRGPRGLVGAVGPTGAAGAAGAKGDNGDRGPANVFAVYHDAAVAVSANATIAHIDLPAGKYAISAKAWLETESNEGPALGQCDLVAGGDTDRDQFVLEQNGVSPRKVDTMPVPLELVHEFATAGGADFTCTLGGVKGAAANIKIVAIQTDSLTNTGV